MYIIYKPDIRLFQSFILLFRQATIVLTEIYILNPDLITFNQMKWAKYYELFWTCPLVFQIINRFSVKKCIRTNFLN